MRLNVGSALHRTHFMRYVISRVCSIEVFSIYFMLHRPEYVGSENHVVWCVWSLHTPRGPPEEDNLMY